MNFPIHAHERQPTSLFFALFLAASIVLAGCGARTLRNRPTDSLAPNDRAMLDQYEQVRAALAQDDPRLAKLKAAAYAKTLQDSAASGSPAPFADYVSQIADGRSLEIQRDAFRQWSSYAIKVTTGVQGFFVIHCPVPGCGDWLQRTTAVDNPFMGKAMHDCGEVQP